MSILNSEKFFYEMKAFTSLRPSKQFAWVVQYTKRPWKIWQQYPGSDISSVAIIDVNKGKTGRKIPVRAPQI